MLWHPDLHPDTEPRRVTLERGEWVDPARAGRTVPYKLYVPEARAGDTSYPVILWSHGLGGTRDGAGFISRYVAAHGYIIAHVQHPGTDDALWAGKPGHPWTHIRAATIPRKTVLARYRDVPFALAQLRAMGVPQADFTRVGMSGHSFGALTTQMMAGQRIAKGRRHYDLYQPDFRAGILYSPVPGRKDPEDPGFVYGGIRIPLLHITGTDDESPLEGFSYERRLNVARGTGRDDQMVVVIPNGDHMVFNGSRGGLGDNPDREAHELIIKVLSLAWWEWHLKGDRTAGAWLENYSKTFHKDDYSHLKR
jgi:dienelactone hydrolase